MSTKSNPHEYADTIIDASARQTLTHTSTKGRWGSLLNMVTEQKNEMVFDGDGRPVLEKTAIRGYHISNPPSGSLTTTPWMYQVWSSVLGQSMTTILPNGTKYETNVFAGGAVIARNNINGVGWKTADPVTGTVGYVGTSAGTVEEFEPLGQKLHNQDPEPPPDPLPTESAWRNADYPEWMCEKQNAMFLYGQFNQWPDACQKRYLQDLDTPLKDLFGWGGKEESPANVSILIRRNIPHGPHDSGPDGGSTYAANSMRSFALTSTAKDDDDDPESKGNKRKRRFSVNVPISPGLDMSDTGWIAASQSDDTYARLAARRLIKPEIDLLARNIRANISEDCAAWIAKLINQVAKDVESTAESTDVATLFELIAANRGGPDKDGDYGGVWGYLEHSDYATAAGSFDSGIVSIGIGISKYARDGLKKGGFETLNGEEQFLRNYESFLRYANTQGDIFFVIHEVIHNSVRNGKASDKALALAATEINGESPPDYTGAQNENTRASAIWDNRLRRACGIPLNYDSKY